MTNMGDARCERVMDANCDRKDLTVIVEVDSKSWRLLLDHDYCKPSATVSECSPDPIPPVEPPTNLVKLESDTATPCSPKPMHRTPPLSRASTIKAPTPKCVLLNGKVRRAPAAVAADLDRKPRIQRLRPARETFATSLPFKRKIAKVHARTTPRIKVRKDLCVTDTGIGNGATVPIEQPRLKVRQDLHDASTASAFPLFDAHANGGADASAPSNSAASDGERAHEACVPSESARARNICTQLREYQRKHPAKRIFACERCDYRTEYEDALTQHRTTHGREPLKCARCAFMAFAQGHLDVHVAMHEGAAVRSGDDERPKRSCRSRPQTFTPNSTSGLNEERRLSMPFIVAS